MADHLFRDNTASIPRVTLRQAEAAKSLGVSERMLFTLTREKNVPHIRFGRVVLYPVEQLHKWAKEQSTQTHKANDQDEAAVDPALCLT